MKTPSKLADTDLCVMCGMCLPHCPTYQLYQSETESPRGRIAVIQSIDQGKLLADQKALTHIDHCLGCLNCQTICPSKVPFGALMDEFRDQYSDQIRKPLASRLVLSRARQPGGLKGLVQLSQMPGLRQLLSVAQKLLGTPSLHLNKNRDAGQPFYPARHNRKGAVSLFTGCVSALLDSQTLEDAAELLSLAGYDVHIPAEQSCCGALHQHNGDQQTAIELRQLQRRPSEADDTPVLFFSPACGHSLQQLDAQRFIDVRQFLLSALEDSSLEFHPCHEPVALHESCSHRNLLRGGSVNTQLLKLIPQLDLITSKQPSLCCGAAGIQSINYPQQGRELGRAKLASFDLDRARILLSDNIGCSMHMQSLLTGYNQDIEVLHPIRFLRRQLIQP